MQIRKKGSVQSIPDETFNHERSKIVIIKKGKWYGINTAQKMKFCDEDFFGHIFLCSVNGTSLLCQLKKSSWSITNKQPD